MSAKEMAWQLMLLLLQVLWLSSSAFAAPIARPGCQAKCGDIDIPYPFGIGGNNCYLNGFDLACNETSHPPKLFLSVSNIEVVRIDFDKGLLQVAHYISRDCYDRKGNNSYRNTPTIRLGKEKPYRFSDAHNKFVAIGCDTIGYFIDMDKTFSTGCVSLCNNVTYVTNNACSGIGCCSTSIPKGLRAFEVKLSSYYRHEYCWNFSPCSYAFLADESFHFNTSVFSTYIDVKRAQVTLEWAIGNKTCEEAQKEEGFACIAGHSECYSSTIGHGYRCNCTQGYQGNPYLPNGCEDIDECSDPHKNQCSQGANCINTPGSYLCNCTQGMQGNGLKNESGCTADHSKSPQENKFRLLDVVLGAGTGFLFLIVSLSWLYWILRKRRLIKLKEKFFRQNGGVLLQHQISSLRGCDGDSIMKIFTSEELQSATKNYDDDCIVGQGGFGTVYKGTLSNQRVVAIKRSKLASKGEVEDFINEVILLSSINHRNVVKLLGCCLETKVPLLVYEFMSNGTLSHHIHDEDHRGSLSLKNRIWIAAETAEALAYLHSSASTPIIHRDVKSTNILLDANFTAKVSDFGTSRLVPFDRNGLTSLVRGTLGYLDPEYFHSGQFTDKSDVYSFGVVLVELLTGEKAVSVSKSGEKKNLAKYFASCLREDRLFEVLEDRLIHEGSKEQLVAIAEIAGRCLRLSGEERPTMREVAMELEGLRTSTKNPWVKEKSGEIEPWLAEPLITEPTHYGTSVTISDGDSSSSYGGLVPFNIMR